MRGHDLRIQVGEVAPYMNAKTLYETHRQIKAVEQFADVNHAA